MSTSNIRVGIVASEWNQLIVDRLLAGARRALAEAAIADDAITQLNVPGAYEIPQGCQALIDANKVDLIVTIGCVIRGETPHFDYVAGECARGVTDVALKTGVPITLGVLTCDNGDQAMARAGGAHGDKGFEAASAALQLYAAIAEL